VSTANRHRRRALTGIAISCGALMMVAGTTGPTAAATGRGHPAPVSAATGVTAKGISPAECAANRRAGTIIFVTSYSYAPAASIADVVAPRERGKYQAYISGVWAAASIAGPVLGGWVTDAASWRWIFWLNVPIGAVAFVLCDRALRMLKARRIKARIDYAGAALLTVAITCPLAGLTTSALAPATASTSSPPTTLR